MRSSVKTFTTTALFAAVTTLSSVALAGEPKGQGLTLTPSFGRMMFDTARQFDDSNFFSLGVGYSFNQRFDVELTYAQAVDDIEVNGSALTDEAEYSQWRLDGLLGLAPTAAINPYLAFGAGEHMLESDDADIDDSEGFFNIGLGAKAFITKQLAVRGDIRQFANFDEVNDNKFHDTAIQIGLTYAFGAPASSPVVSEPEPVPEPVEKDSDGDGVLDSKDQCPNTAAGVEVDAKGCPRDDDKDGVVNAIDQCPDTSIGAKVDEKGCYLLITETKEINLNVNFAVNSAVVPAEAMSDIKKVADFMVEYPITDVIVEGHTDNTGNDSYNQQLSEKRAKSVANALVTEFGINPSRVDYVGYGEAKPIASNATKEGRRQNRRVVAKIKTSVTKEVK